MVNITIIGLGTYGALINEKYTKFNNAIVKAIVVRNKQSAKKFTNIPFVLSALEWQKCFGKPKSNDVFDLCIHESAIVKIIESFISIGAKNFILPKPIALDVKSLEKILKLTKEHKLDILIASQWHYSRLVLEIYEFIKNNNEKISFVEINFSRTFAGGRERIYKPITAFLPHILQILFTTKLINNKNKLIVKEFDNTKIKFDYFSKFNIKVVSDLQKIKKIETLKIYFKGYDEPKLIADFVGILGDNGFIQYPSLTIFEKKHQVCEDLLEIMIKNSLAYFQNGRKNKKALTLSKYLPIAKEQIRINNHGLNCVAVIGGGIFGVMSALEIAKKGYPVIIYEKESQIIKGASLINQCRVHMGYHYPRDENTAKESRLASSLFNKYFAKAIVHDVENYYLIAKKDSLTNPEEYISFCNRMNLAYEVRWPNNIDFLRDKIEASFKVPEKIFDALTIKKILDEKIRNEPNITLLTNSEVVGIKKIDDVYNIEFRHDKTIINTKCSALVNASYGNLNVINALSLQPTVEYQYELCEEFIVRTPWGKTGFAIMDGPFFGIMPFGNSENHIFYDVELSVLERVVGKSPKFIYDINYYRDPKGIFDRFEAYKEKWRHWLPDVVKCTPVSSMLITRIVLAGREKTDARPTLTQELSPGFWQIFSGKITTCTTQAFQIGLLVDAYMMNHHITQ